MKTNENLEARLFWTLSLSRPDGLDIIVSLALLFLRPTAPTMAAAGGLGVVVFTGALKNKDPPYPHVNRKTAKFNYPRQLFYFLPSFL
ncbi:MAG TPA: hypothetical protein ENJ54_00705 [Chloroflexi bacterium]|nr:hypothetical protein [Chloroflexota bacterium]